MNIILTSKEELTELISNAVKAVIPDTFSFQKKEPPKKEVFGINEASELLGIAKPTIYTKTSKGEIPHYKKGKKLYFKRSELLDWLEDGKRKTLNEELSEQETYFLNKKRTKSC